MSYGMLGRYPSASRWADEHSAGLAALQGLGFGLVTALLAAIGVVFTGSWLVHLVVGGVLFGLLMYPLNRRAATKHDVQANGPASR